MKYRDVVEDWMDLWLTTDEELRLVASAAGWILLEERIEGPSPVRLFQSAAV